MARTSAGVRRARTVAVAVTLVWLSALAAAFALPTDRAEFVLGAAMLIVLATAISVLLVAVANLSAARRPPLSPQTSLL